MRRLDRYVMTEIIGPLGLGFLIYTFILLLRVFFRAARWAIGSDVSLDTIGRLLLLSLPNIVVLTIPMSLLFAILIAVGRLSSESELVAIRACGISLFTLYRPILVISALLTSFNIYLMLDILPDGNHAVEQLRTEILTKSFADEVEPRTPYTGWQNQLLYVFESPPGERRWRGTFLAEAIPSGETRIEVAQWGEAKPSSDGSKIDLSLINAVTHRVDLRNPDVYDISSHETIDLSLLSTSPREAASSAKRSLRSMPFQQLLHVAGDANAEPVVRTLAQVELHKKFSIPAACLVFGLLALPLGFNNSRGGRSSGFAISIGVVMLYYIFLNWGEDFAKKGSAPPWLAVWLPNLVLMGLGLLLLARRNRDKSLLLSKMDRWIQEHLWRRVLRWQERRSEKKKRAQQKRAAKGRGAFVLRMPDLYLPFPNLMDRYVLRTFVRVLSIASLAGLTVYVVADLTENAEHMLRNDVPTDIVLDYYKLKSIAILYEISPIIVLVSTLICFGMLSRTNEITASKALGMSLYRLAVPVVFVSTLVAVGAGVLQFKVLTGSEVRISELRDVIRGNPLTPVGPRADRRWLYGKTGGYLYNYSYFDEKHQEIHQLQVFKFDEDYQLTDRLLVQRARYLGEQWWEFEGGWARSFDGAEELGYRKIEETVKEQLPEPPEFFRGEKQRPNEMDYFSLRDHIQDLKRIGSGDTAPLEVELHNKIAYPFLSLVMAFVALPFAFRLGRAGALYGIGISIVLGIVLLAFLAVFSAMGENAILPPIVAVWSPGLIFSILSLYLFLGIRT